MKTISKTLLAILFVGYSIGQLNAGGYERVSYIQSKAAQGGGTWINTKYVPLGTDRIEFRVRLDSITTSQGYYCSRMGSTDRAFDSIMSANKLGYLRFDRNNNNSSGYSSLAMNTTDIYDIVADYNTLDCTIDGNSVATMAGGDFSPVGPLVFFALYNGASPSAAGMMNYAFTRFYSSRIYSKEGVLIREFLPVVDRSADAESPARCGLFETITGTFLPNDGAVAFGLKTGEPIGRFNVSEIPPQHISKVPCKPVVTVTDTTTGTKLTAETDYDVSYVNNAGLGTAYVTVAGKSGSAYEGMVVYENFQIVEDLGLPEGYTKLTYIESTQNGGEWIDTEYVPACTDRFELKIRTFATNRGEGLYCSRIGSAEDALAAVYPSANAEYLRFDRNTNNTLGVSSVRRIANQDTVIVSDNSSLKCSIDGAEVANMAPGSFITAGPIALFGLYNTVIPHEGEPLFNNAYMRLYSFSVYDRNGVLVREFVPARDDSAANGKQYGMYETVTSTFHPNFGPSGDFVPGDVVAVAPSAARFSVADIPAQVLKNAVCCEPETEVSDVATGVSLVRGRDYDVRYIDNKRAGSGKVVVSGRAGTAYYGLSIVKTFLISYRQLGGQYQRVKFIRSNGGQHILTGYTPSCTDRIEFRFRPNVINAQGYYCSRADAQQDTISLIMPSANLGHLRFDRNTDNATAVSEATVKTTRDYLVESDGSSLECSINGSPMATMEGGEFTPNYPFMLFAAYRGTTGGNIASPASCTFYEFQVWNKDGILVCDCVPARDTRAAEGSVKQCGVYDLISRKFYPNEGDQAFAEYGEDEPFVPGPRSGLMLMLR